jgi:hypothetical protein
MGSSADVFVVCAIQCLLLCTSYSLVSPFLVSELVDGTPYSVLVLVIDTFLMSDQYGGAFGSLVERWKNVRLSLRQFALAVDIS